MPVSLSLTAIPSTVVLGPARGRPDRAAAAWPCLASRSVCPGKHKLSASRWCHTAPLCRLPGQPRCTTAARQARPRAGRSGRPRGGPRLKARNSRERSKQASSSASVTETQNEGASNSVCAGCLFLYRSRLFQATDVLGPPRGRPDRAAAAWPCLASRSDSPGKHKLRASRWCHTAPLCRLPGQPRRVAAARQARLRAGRSGRPRGGPRLKARNSRERNKQAPHSGVRHRNSDRRRHKPRPRRTPPITAMPDTLTRPPATPAPHPAGRPASAHSA